MKMFVNFVLASVSLLTISTIDAFSLTASTSVGRDGGKAKTSALFSNLPPEVRRHYLKTSTPSFYLRYSKQRHQSHIHNSVGMRPSPLSQYALKHQAPTDTSLLPCTAENIDRPKIARNTTLSAVVKSDRTEKPLSPEELQFRAEAQARMQKWQLAQQQRRDRIMSKSSSMNDDDERAEATVLSLPDLVKDVESSEKVDDESTAETTQYDQAFNDAMIQLESDCNNKQNASQSILPDFDGPLNDAALDEVSHQIEKESLPAVMPEKVAMTLTKIRKKPMVQIEVSGRNSSSLFSSNSNSLASDSLVTQAIAQEDMLIDQLARLYNIDYRP